MKCETVDCNLDALYGIDDPELGYRYVCEVDRAVFEANVYLHNHAPDGSGLDDPREYRVDVLGAGVADESPDAHLDWDHPDSEFQRECRGESRLDDGCTIDTEDL